MIAGRLRKRVELQSNTPVANAIGEHVPGWATVATVWAGITPVSGSERFRNNMESAEVSHKIKIRYYAGLTPAMRIKLGSRLFDIQSIINLQERNADMEILALEQVPT